MMFKTIGSCSTAYGTCAAAVRGFLRQYPDPAGSRNVQASCVQQPETFHQRGDQVTAQTISEWLKKQMGAGGIPASGFHVPNEHMMTRGKNRDRRKVDPANTT